MSRMRGAVLTVLAGAPSAIAAIAALRWYGRGVYWDTIGSSHFLWTTAPDAFVGALVFAGAAYMTHPPIKGAVRVGILSALTALDAAVAILVLR